MAGRTATSGATVEEGGEDVDEEDEGGAVEEGTRESTGLEEEGG